MPAGPAGRTAGTSVLPRRDPGPSVVSTMRGRCGGAHSVTLPVYRGRREREGPRGGWREGGNDWNKIFTAAAGAGP